MDDATLTPDAGAPSPPLPALLPPRALEATLAEQTADPARRPRTPHAPVAARGWDVAHAATLRALLTQPPAVLPNQVGDPLLPLRIGVRDALLALLRAGDAGPARDQRQPRLLRWTDQGRGWRKGCKGPQLLLRVGSCTPVVERKVGLQGAFQNRLSLCLPCPIV
jgi:hypothetical protein